MPENNPVQYRQGDVFIELVESIPENTTPIKREHGAVILAHGEVTGHYHGIKNRVAKFYQAESGERFLDLSKPSDLTHQEHATITLPPGKYRVRQQREYTPEAIRNVAD